jgi:hypothetical protein
MNALTTRTMLWLLGGLYVAAGALKIADPLAFARAITDYDLLPDALVPAVAVLLPWWEVAAGLLAVAGRWRGGALALLAGMSAVFLLAGVVTLARGLSPECGCFGPLSGRLGATTLSVELAALASGAWLLRVETLGDGDISRRAR